MYLYRPCIYLDIYRTYACVMIYVCMYVCMYECVYMCMCVCLYVIYAYTFLRAAYPVVLLTDTSNRR